MSEACRRAADGGVQMRSCSRKWTTCASRRGLYAFDQASGWKSADARVPLSTRTTHAFCARAVLVVGVEDDQWLCALTCDLCRMVSVLT